MFFYFSLTVKGFLNYCTVSDAFTGTKSDKIPAEMDMTDGCGFANAQLLNQLKDALEWDRFPTAVQCRLGGAKVSARVDA